MRHFYIIFLLILCTGCVHAQTEGVRLLPLSTYPILETYSELPRVESLAPDSIDLPFIDDFSYAGPYPDPNLWLDNRVFINNSMGFSPPQ